MLQRMLSPPTLLYLLPLVPFTTLVLITIFLRPSCHTPKLITSHTHAPAPSQACSAYHILAIIRDILFFLGLFILILPAWDKASSCPKDADLETGSYDSQNQYWQEQDDYFIGSTERSRLLPQAYTFGVRELPLLCDYGTMVGVDPEVTALLAFHRVDPDEPVEELRCISPRPWSITSAESWSEIAGGRVEALMEGVQGVQGFPGDLWRGGKSAMEDDTGDGDRGGDGEEDEDGWTRWRWRHDAQVLSESPESYEFFV